MLHIAIGVAGGIILAVAFFAILPTLLRMLTVVAIGGAAVAAVTLVQTYPQQTLSFVVGLVYFILGLGVLLAFLSGWLRLKDKYFTRKEQP